MAATTALKSAGSTSPLQSASPASPTAGTGSTQAPTRATMSTLVTRRDRACWVPLLPMYIPPPVAPPSPWWSSYTSLTPLLQLASVRRVAPTLDASSWFRRRHTDHDLLGRTEVPILIAYFRCHHCITRRERRHGRHLVAELNGPDRCIVSDEHWFLCLIHLCAWACPTASRASVEHGESASEVVQRIANHLIAVGKARRIDAWDSATTLRRRSLVTHDRRRVAT